MSGRLHLLVLISLLGDFWLLIQSLLHVIIQILCFFLSQFLEVCVKNLPVFKIFYFGLSSFLAYNCKIIFIHFYKVTSDTLLIFDFFKNNFIFVLLVICLISFSLFALLGLCDLSFGPGIKHTLQSRKGKVLTIETTREFSLFLILITLEFFSLSV